MIPDGLLDNQLTRHKETAAAKTLLLLVQNACGVAWLDPNVIGRILDNLLTNAIRHAPPGGRVVVEVERHPTLLILTITDTGNGVGAELTERLFEPFVTSRPEGTGLGLAIARELADAHASRLVLRNPGTSFHGAIFALEIPQERMCQPS